MPLKLRPTGLSSGIDKGARTTSEPPNVVSSEGKISRLLIGLALQDQPKFRSRIRLSLQMTGIDPSIGNMVTTYRCQECGLLDRAEVVLLRASVGPSRCG